MYRPKLGKPLGKLAQAETLNSEFDKFKMASTTGKCIEFKNRFALRTCGSQAAQCYSIQLECCFEMSVPETAES